MRCAETVEVWRRFAAGHTAQRERPEGRGDEEGERGSPHLAAVTGGWPAPITLAARRVEDWGGDY